MREAEEEARGTQTGERQSRADVRAERECERPDRARRGPTNPARARNTLGKANHPSDDPGRLSDTPQPLPPLSHTQTLHPHTFLGIGRAGTSPAPGAEQRVVGVRWQKEKRAGDGQNPAGGIDRDDTHPFFPARGRRARAKGATGAQPGRPHRHRSPATPAPKPPRGGHAPDATQRQRLTERGAKPRTSECGRSSHGRPGGRGGTPTPSTRQRGATSGKREVSPRPSGRGRKSVELAGEDRHANGERARDPDSGQPPARSGGGGRTHRELGPHRCTRDGRREGRPAALTPREMGETRGGPRARGGRPETSGRGGEDIDRSPRRRIRTRARG